MSRVLIALSVAIGVVALGQTWDYSAQAQSPSPTTTTTVVATPPAPTPTPTPVAVPAVAPYFSLGDSIADAEGATSRAAGYVALFATKAWPLLGFPGTPADRGDFGLRGGETSTSMLAPGGQLDRATAEISRRNSDADKANDVKLITVDVGGNDFRALTRSTSPCRVNGVTSPECGAAVTEVTAAFNANYPVILQRIRAAAGPDTIILAMAFYNPFSGTGQAVDGPGDLVAGQITVQAKAVATAAPVNAVWVDLFALFKGKAPQLTHINDAQSDIHPTDAGYAVIADAMFEALKAATAKPSTPAPPTVGTGPGASGTNAELLWLAGFALIGVAGVSLAVAGRVRR